MLSEIRFHFKGGSYVAEKVVAPQVAEFKALVMAKFEEPKETEEAYKVWVIQDLATRKPRLTAICYRDLKESMKLVLNFDPAILQEA